MEDLAEFRVELERPVKTTYNEYEVHGCGPWCQGPVLLQALNILENFDLNALGHNSAEYIHLLAEALKLAFADREKFYGDPKFVDVPIEALLSKEYAKARSTLINPAKAWPGIPPFGDPQRCRALGTAQRELGQSPESVDRRAADTSYVCAVDASGNAFSATPSDPSWDTPIVPGLGFTISSRGSQSWLDPRHASCLAPGKRPRLTPNPALAFREGQLFLAFGTPGADVQCQAMLQMFLNIVEFSMNPQLAVEAPRFASTSFPASFWPHEYQPGELLVESRIARQVLDELVRRGHRVKPWPDWSPEAGGLCGVLKGENGVLMGAADPRRESYAFGW